MGRDANNHMFPIAWAVVGVENNVNCSWFLSLIRDDLNLGDGEGINIISDGHKHQQRENHSVMSKGYTRLHPVLPAATFASMKYFESRTLGLWLPEELSGVHDTFHVSTLKKCLADASLHVPLNEIKVDKTLRFIEEPVEILDREVKSLKRSKISLVKVRWDSKRGPEFTWEREDFMKSKYPQLFVDRADESAN
ncbi:hypothetical protein Tco_1046221 [Tanacetum coccineum]